MSIPVQASFWVDAAGTLASLCVAIAATVVAWQAHRFTRRAHQDQQRTASESARRAFAADLEGYAELIPLSTQPASGVSTATTRSRLYARAFALGPDFVWAVGQWRRTEEVVAKLSPTERQGDTAGKLLAAASMETAAWVVSGQVPNEPAPFDPGRRSND